MGDLDDAEWLRGRILAGAKATELAEETGHTAREVRDALRTHGIPLPRDRRVAHVDWAMVEHDWRKGYLVRTIARLYGLTEHQVVYRMRNTPRVPLPPQRPSKYPLLNDAVELRIGLALGRTVSELARDVGCARRVLVAALRRHGIVVPPRSMSRLDRVSALTDPVERARAAARLEADVRAELSATTRIRKSALRESDKQSVRLPRR